MWAEDSWLQKHAGETLNNKDTEEGGEQGDGEEGDGEQGTKRPADELDEVKFWISILFYISQNH